MFRLEERGQALDVERDMRMPTRLLRLALLGVAVALVLAVAAAAGPSRDCTHGTSSVGPAVLINGHLVHDQSDLTPHGKACFGRDRQS
jgi:hypothetical protein